jgi:ADP-heptose:LPS heptosyltransferase
MDLHASNILLCLRYGIGDLVMELPVLDRLRAVLPQATITGLGAEPAVEILEGDNRLNEVVPIQRWGIRHLGDPADEQVCRRFTDWLVGSQFDLILDPSHAAGVVRQIIHQQDVRIPDCDPACLEVGLAQGLDGLSAVKQATCQGWGLEVPISSAPVVRLAPEEIDRAQRFLEQEGLRRDIVAISPGASDDLKRWPVEHFARLCRYVVEDLGAGVLVFCGPGEAKLLHELGERTRDLPQMEIVQNLHLRQVAALLSQCRLCLGNDSGLMHLAAAVGTPVVILFGPTVPHLYLPQWVRSQAVASGVACPYRPRRAFGHPRCVLAGSCLTGTPCIQTIDPAQVCTTVKGEYAKCLPRTRS